MDGSRRLIGKWFSAATAATVATVVGCGTTGTQVTSNQTPPQALTGQTDSRLARVFGPRAPGPLPHQQQEISADRTATTTGAKPTSLLPKTDVTFADVQVEAAFGSENPTPDQNRMIDAARARYQKVLAKDPVNVDALRGLARLYTRSGDKERAFATYRQLVQAAPKDHKAMHEFALACGRFDEWQSAAAACEQSLTADPENRRYHRTYGVALARLGQYERSFEAMLKAAPEAEARYTLARVLQDTDQMDMAKQQMQLAAAADPTYAPAKEWLSDPAGSGVVQVQYQTPAGK